MGKGASRALGENIPPPNLKPPRLLEVPPVQQGGAATEQVIRENQNDGVAKDIVCFVYENFSVDPATGALIGPTRAGFVEAVVQQLAPRSQVSYRSRANSLHSKLTDPETDLREAATAVGCAFRDSCLNLATRSSRTLDQRLPVEGRERASARASARPRATNAATATQWAPSSSCA